MKYKVGDRVVWKYLGRTDYGTVTRIDWEPHYAEHRIWGEWDGEPGEVSFVFESNLNLCLPNPCPMEVMSCATQ